MQILPEYIHLVMQFSAHRQDRLGAGQTGLFVLVDQVQLHVLVFAVDAVLTVRVPVELYQVERAAADLDGRQLLRWLDVDLLQIPRC